MNGMSSHEYRGPHILHDKIESLEARVANQAETIRVLQQLNVDLMRKINEYQRDYRRCTKDKGCISSVS